MAELRAELRALRESNARLERRLERIESQAAVLSSRPSPAASTARAEPGAEPGLVVPALTVVKLKPKTEAAPPLDTSTPVVEPSPEVVEELVAMRRASRDEGGETDPALLNGLYESGLEALRTGNLVGGVTRLQQFALENPRHAKADNALYFSGLGLMGQEEFAQAARTFEQLLAQYPAGDAVVDTLLKLAECRMKLNQPKDAKALYVQLISNYPGTAAASQAEARLASLIP